MNGFRNFTKAIKNTDKWRNLENENLLRTNELSEKNILIIGLGRIGKKIKKYAQAFEMNVSYYDPYVYDSSINRIDELKNLQKYDCISVNCYLNDETKNIIDREFLSQIKNNCILVNTSRGEVVNESDIVDFIIRNGNFYFGADVLCNEQNIDKLLKSKIYSLSKKIENVVITPHVAGATIESQTKAFNAIIKLFQENNV
jgi:D-3-phosphoglycerate dehydrogenase